MQTPLFLFTLAAVSVFTGCATHERTARPISSLEPEITRIAFGSCTRQDKPMPVWTKIAEAKPQLMIMLGDNVYGDTEDMSVLRGKYDLLAADPGVKAVFSSARVLATWDDHDMGKNDAGVEYPMKEESKRELFRFIDEPADSARQNRPGVYDTYLMGPPGRRLQVILLDTRWFRSPLKQVVDDRRIKHYVPTDDPNATVLGQEQWTWLEAQLKQPADLRIIVSSIQVLSDQHRFEKWGNFPRERQRLLDLIDRYEPRTVVVLSGDRHTAEISKLDRAGRGPLYDVTASSINQGGGGQVEPNPYRISADRFGKANFGLLEIDWSARDITIQIRDQSGATVDATTAYME